MADTLRKDVLTGARIGLTIDGRDVGHMTEVTVSVQFQLVNLEECGTPIPTAILIVGTQVMATAAYAKIRTTDPVRDLLVPKMDAASLINWPEMVGTLVDRHNGDAPVCQIGNITPESYDIRGGARMIVMQNLRFRGRVIRHPSEG